MNVREGVNLVCGAFAAGRPAHGYLVIGPPRGAGQELVEQVLQRLLCTGGAKPCGVCQACRSVRQHTHPDLRWIEPEKKSRQFGKETIQELNRMANQTSYAGGWRAGVLVHADRLTPQAENAFLKTLEEPPPHCAFFLLSDAPQALLPTVLSRCQRVTVEGADERLTEDVARRVTGLLALPRPQRMLFAFGQSDGLKALLDEVKQAIMESEATGEDADGDVEDDVLDARVSAKLREVRTAVMQRVLAWHRDVAMVVCGCEGLVGNAADLDALRLAAQDLSLRAALRNVQIVEAMNRRLERYMPDETVFEHGFSRIMAGNDGKGKPSQQ